MQESFFDFLKRKNNEAAPKPSSVKTSGALKPYPKEKMRLNMTDDEKPWEERELQKYHSDMVHHFHGKDGKFDKNVFWKKYHDAPLEHMSDDAMKKMDYATAGNYMHAGEDKIHKIHGHRRDTKRIVQGVHQGGLPPPIVFRRKDGSHKIMGGNTRLSTAAAMGHSLPVKMIDV